MAGESARGAKILERTFQPVKSAVAIVDGAKIAIEFASRRSDAATNKPIWRHGAASITAMFWTGMVRSE